MIIKEDWMAKGQPVSVSGQKGKIHALKEQTIQGKTFVNFIEVMFPTETIARRYFPKEVSKV